MPVERQLGSVTGDIFLAEQAHCLDHCGGQEECEFFVRSVVAMGLHIKPLPRERCIGMRLYYNPEVSFRVLGSLFWTSFSRFELASLQANAQEME